LFLVEFELEVVKMTSPTRMVLLAALAFSVISPASFAAHFFFLKGALSGPAGTEAPGTLTIAENTFGTHPPLTFNIPSPVTSQIYTFKNGECLDQGVNNVGIGNDASGTATVINADVSGYTLSLSVNVPAEATNPNCTSTADPVRTASLSGPSGFTTVNGTYHLYNTASIPEPGTMALLGLGLGVLAVSLRRKRAPR
jgi:hypothetical protein